MEENTIEQKIRGIELFADCAFPDPITPKEEREFREFKIDNLFMIADGWYVDTDAKTDKIINGKVTPLLYHVNMGKRGAFKIDFIQKDSLHKAVYEGFRDEMLTNSPKIFNPQDSNLEYKYKYGRRLAIDIIKKMIQYDER